MKTKAEIQRAHDVLCNIIITPELKDQFDAHQMKNIVQNCDVLCWVLDHDHNPTFQANLKVVEAILAAQGWELVKNATPTPP